MEIKNNEAKESFVSDLRDAPFNKIEPERDITLEEAMKILDRYRRPPHEEFPRDQGTMKFPRPSEENSRPPHEEFPRDTRKWEFPEQHEPLFVTASEKGERTSESDEYKETQESDVPERKGGRYADVFKDGEGDTTEVHHMPADSVSPLERNDGPAIKMDKADHQMTASWGSSRDAREYRAKQKELIERGKIREAIQMDIDDIHDKFGDKYDDAIAEMMEYVDQLEAEGKING